MKRCLFLIIILLLIPLSIAWNWNTHQAVVEKIYYSLPLEMQNNLNITLMKKGSIAPDKDFHDNVLHHYPPSLNKSNYWINLTLIYLNNKNYQDASYSFGVLTHYLDDSFVAPHYIAKEDYRLHSEFENQVNRYIIKAKCQKNDYDLNGSLYIGSLNKKDWEKWLLYHDKNIPQQELEDATRLVYNVALDIFNLSCNPTTKFQKLSFQLRPVLLIELAIISIIIILILVSIMKDVKLERN